MLVSETFYSLEKINTLFLNSNIRYVGCQKSKKSVKSFLRKSATQKCNYWTGKQIGSSHLNPNFEETKSPFHIPASLGTCHFDMVLKFVAQKAIPFPVKRNSYYKILKILSFELLPLAGKTVWSEPISLLLLPRPRLLNNSKMAEGTEKSHDCPQ